MKQWIHTISSILLVILTAQVLFCQKHDQYWLGTVDGINYYHVVFMRFGEEGISYSVTQEYAPVMFDRGVLAMSNAEGELQFYTNGNVVVSRDNQIMQGGKGFNKGSTGDDFRFEPPWYLGPDTVWNSNYYPYTYQIIPDAYDPHIYYMIHALIKEHGECKRYDVPKMQISKIDMSANGGLGQVVYKNRYFDQEPMGMGGCLVRHGNGRDWWVVLRKQDGLAYRSILLHRDSVVQVVQSSISGLSTDWFSSWEDCYHTSLCFLTPSPDGSRLVDKYGADWAKLMAFDRCSGEVSLLDTFKTGIIPLVTASGRVFYCANDVFEFSSSGRYLYGAGYAEFAQWDLESSNITASKIKLGGVPWALDDQQNVMVGFSGGLTAFGTGPDGNIYNLMRSSHSVIRSPNEKGEGSGLCLAADNAPGSCLGPDVPYYLFSARHPNYRLGALRGSGCDTIPRDLGPPVPHEAPYTDPDIPDPKNYDIVVRPNPATDQTVVEITLPDYESGTAEIQIVDMLGRILHTYRFPKYAYLYHLDLSAWASGVYNITLWDKGLRRAKARLVVVR